jgi:pectate lyase
MKRGSLTHAMLGAGLLLAILTPAFGKTDPADPNRYLNAVREFADNVLKYGRDTYGPKHTPLFVDGLNIHTHEPVKWIAPNGDRWILSNLASQQNLFRTLDGLTKTTGDPKYKQAAMDAIKYAFENLRNPNGLLYWGGHSAYDVGADKPCGRGVHELKGFYPYYELMWEVDPQATRQFIEAFWSGHIRDWSNLDMDRHCYRMNEPLGKPWKHEYKGGPVFFEGTGMSAQHAGSDLFYAAAWLTKFTGNKEPLVWGKRLAYRYVQTRHPKTGISIPIFSVGPPSQVQHGDEVVRKLGPVAYVFPYQAYANRAMSKFELGYDMPTPGTFVNPIAAPWLCQLMLGEPLGEDGKEFTQWAVEELTAWGKVAYRRRDNAFIPMIPDGTSLEGYVCKEDGPLGFKGTSLEPVPAGPTDFWAYALAYCVTTHDFMWEMARDIAQGNNYGDLGASVTDAPQLNLETDLSDPYVLWVFLELHRKIGKQAFLQMAQRIGDNILTHRFHNGFVVPDNQYTFTKFDSIDPLVLLHLHTVLIRDRNTRIPEVWPARPFFDEYFRRKDPAIDNQVIYTVRGLSEPPRSLQEAAAEGDVEAVRSMIVHGVDVNGREDSFFKTALHRAAMNGHKNVAEVLLAKGANVDARDSYVSSPLHYAAQNGHTDTVGLLISKGADVNAKNGAGEPPLQGAARFDRKDTIQLLLEKGATIATIHLAAHMGDLAKTEAFIQGGANVNAWDGHGYKPLHYAAQNSRKQAIELLLAKGADVNAKNWEGRTALDLAKQRGHKEIAELLRTHGAKPTDQAQSLHKAVADHNIAQVKSLLSQGINVNGKDETGDTPLHCAAKIARDAGKDVCELLIASGASVNATNKVGWTPLHAAVEFGNLEVARLLIADGADVNARDSSGRAPLYLAAAGGHTEITELLNSHIRIPSPADASFADSTPDLILTPESSIAPQQFGCFVDCADVNGDGYDDCLVTAGNYNNDQGRVYLYYGGPSMDGRPDKIFTGEAAGDLFGEAAALGDVNGDHFADVIIAAIRYDNKRGRVLIYYGGPDMDTDPDVILEGERGTSGRFGRVIDTADIDRDGYADVVVNALFYASEAGRAYLYYGGNPMNTLPAKIFDGENPGDMFGREMDMGGDVNGDGYGDLIFGCRAWSSLRGRAYLYYGGPRDSMDSTCDKMFTGESAGDEFGSSVCLFDVDKDGYADVMIGARKYSKNTPPSYEGRMYMYWGGPDINLNADLIFEGERGVGSCFGGDSIQCGYFNDDRYPDIVASAWGYRTSQGRVCLYYGGPRASMDTVCDHTFTGEMGTEACMYGVRNAVGDFNGDKRSDLLVGAPWYPSGNRLGRAYVYYTKPFPPGRQPNPAKPAQQVPGSNEAPAK